MEGEYVKWHGQLAQITHEFWGIATIRLIKRRSCHQVYLHELSPINLQPIKCT